jgi:hypothetical protein
MKTETEIRERWEELKVELAFHKGRQSILDVIGFMDEEREENETQIRIKQALIDELSDILP